MPTDPVVTEKLGEILGGVNDIRERFDKVEHTLYGNGQPGLTTRVVVLEKWAEDAARQAEAAKAEAEKSKDNVSDWKKQLIMTVLGGIFGGGAILGGGKATGVIGGDVARASPPAATQPSR